jgi:hypothetical protein
LFLLPGQPTFFLFARRLVCLFIVVTERIIPVGACVVCVCDTGHYCFISLLLLSSLGHLFIYCTIDVLSFAAIFLSPSC